MNYVQGIESMLKSIFCIKQYERAVDNMHYHTRTNSFELWNLGVFTVIASN